MGLICRGLCNQQCGVPRFVTTHSFSGCEYANVHVKSFVVCKMAQDVGITVKVLWCHSDLVWQVLWVPSIFTLVFIQKTFL